MSWCFYIDELVLFCGFTEKIDLLESGCSCTQNVPVNKWICRNNLIFVSSFQTIYLSLHWPVFIFFFILTKDMVCKLYLVIWRHQLISLSTYITISLSEIDSYKLKMRQISYKLSVPNFVLSAKCARLFHHSCPLL